jgi:hypothetical protein
MLDPAELDVAPADARLEDSNLRSTVPGAILIDDTDRTTAQIPLGRPLFVDALHRESAKQFGRLPLRSE